MDGNGLHFDALPHLIGGVDDHELPRIQSGQDFRLGAEVPDHIDLLEMHFISLGHQGDLNAVRARHERMAWAYTFDLADDLFRRCRLFVTCQTVEDLPYLLRFGTEDNLLLGTDYTHADASAEIQSFEILQRWGDEGKVSKEVVRKILDDNPRAFYRL